MATAPNGESEAASSMETESSNGAASGSGVETLMHLHKTKLWTESQKLQHEAALRAAVDTEGEEDPTNVSDLHTRIARLQEELREASTDVAVREMIVQRLQLGDTALKILFPPVTGSGDFPSDNKTQQTVLQLIEEQMRLSSEILRVNKLMTEKRPKLDELRKKSLEKKVTNRQLMSAIKQNQQTEEQRQQYLQSTEEIASLKEKLTHLKSKVVVQQNIFQGLIIGSGVNWAQDPELEKLVISLGSPLED